MIDPDDISSPLLVRAGVRSLPELERGLQRWFLSGFQGDYRIVAVRRQPRRGWMPDTDNAVYLPERVDAAAVAEHFAGKIERSASDAR